MSQTELGLEKAILGNGAEPLIRAFSTTRISRPYGVSTYAFCVGFPPECGPPGGSTTPRSRRALKP
jgi:hypothetical protein